LALKGGFGHRRTRLAATTLRHRKDARAGRRRACVVSCYRRSRALVPLPRERLAATGRILDVVRAFRRVPQPWRTILDWLVTIAVAVAFVLAFEAEVAKPFRIPSSSMEPTLHCAKPGAYCLGSFNDRVLANRLAYRFGSPKRGQIVVFDAPPATKRCGTDEAGTYVKRLIGLPGEQVSERDGFIYIDGGLLHEPYVDPALRDHGSGTWPTIAPRHYFFLGDDRVHSCDSRTWGTVPRSSLIGPLLLTYWPPSRIGFH
jgi:signal peptidase I